MVSAPTFTPFLALFALLTSLPAFAMHTPQSLAETHVSSWTQLKKKFRVRSFHEWMTPSVQSQNVPDHEGGDLTPSNLYGYFWIDYEITRNWRLLYWQRELLEFSGGPTGSGMQLAFWDPRFGIRKTQVFDLAGLTTNYDFFIQPGITASSVEKGKYFDLGFRTNTNYAIPQSRWSIGLLTELFAGVYSSEKFNPNTTNFSGFVSPWINYNLTDTISTQHWLLLPFQHRMGDPLFQLSWDMPTNMAVVQNGIGIDLSDSLWVSVLLNTYLNKPPTLQTSWLSLWVSMTYL